MSDVKVTFLGSGDAFNSGGRLHTSIFIHRKRHSFLIDCGPSVLAAIRRLHIDPNEIAFILLSHLHGDHFGGIPFFILDAHFMSKRTTPLLIAGPPGTKQRITDLMEVMFPGSTHNKYKFALDIVEYDLEKENVFHDVHVHTFPVKHPSGSPSLALRLEFDHKVVTFSGDTEWVDELIHAAHGADLFITECYAYDQDVKFHLNYQTLSAHIGEIKAEQIVLTHLNQDMLSHLKDLSIPFAVDGKTFVI